MQENRTEQDAAFAAEFNADISRERLAEVYATAFAGACDAQKVDFEAAMEEFASLIEDVFRPNPKFEEILASAMVSDKEKSRILEELLKNASPIFRNFLTTVARRGRLDLLRDIYAQSSLLLNKRKGLVSVEITTASEMDEATRNNLIARLRDLVEGEPVIKTVVDPEMIGGVIVRVGDKILDASIATQLKNVRQQMIDRSAHEIQSRRDSFRYPEGN